MCVCVCVCVCVCEGGMCLCISIGNEGLVTRYDQVLSRKYNCHNR